MSNDIPASVMDALARAEADRVNLGDRGDAMKWLTYHDHREEARWVMTHPAEYPRVLDSLRYWRAA